MLLGARQGCVEGETLIDKMKTLAHLGYDFLELALSQEEITQLNDDSPQPYLDMIKESGLPILSTSLGHFGGFAAKSSEERQQILSDISKLIKFTKAVGADAILLATSEQSWNVGDYASVYRNELRAVADEALDAGVTLAMEHVGWYKPWALAKLVQAVDHPAVGVYFDMGNCLYVGEDPVAMARICAPVTAQLHIKGGPTTPLAAMPLVEVREILEDAGFQNRGALEIPSMRGNRHLAEALALLRMSGY